LTIRCVQRPLEPLLLGPLEESDGPLEDVEEPEEPEELSDDPDELEESLDCELLEELLDGPLLDELDEPLEDESEDWLLPDDGLDDEELDEPLDEELDDELEEELDELLLSEELEELDEDELEDELEEELDEELDDDPQQAPKLSTSHHWLSKKYFVDAHVPLGIYKVPSPEGWAKSEPVTMPKASWTVMVSVYSSFAQSGLATITRAWAEPHAGRSSKSSTATIVSAGARRTSAQWMPWPASCQRICARPCVPLARASVRPVATSANGSAISPG
jgi:hypothetical protein